MIKKLIAAINAIKKLIILQPYFKGFNSSFIITLLLSRRVNEFLKLVSIWQCYG